MPIYLLSTQPRIGREQENVERIAQALSKLESSEEVLCIVSNSAIMGLGCSAYGYLADFSSRQTLALERLQQQLRESFVVICSTWNQQMGCYETVAVSRKEIKKIESLYHFQEKGKDRKILCISSSHTKDADVDHQNIDAVVLLEEFAFETNPTNPMKVSLAGRNFLSGQKIQKLLLDYFSRRKVPCLSVPVYGQFQGILWDGSFGITDSKGNSTFTSFPDQLIELEEASFRPRGREWRSQLMIERIFTLLCDHIRSYVESLRVNGVIVALSGGIDSALVAALATKALGPDRVLGLLLPGPFSSPESLSDAQILCHNLKIPYEIRSIISLYEEGKKVLDTPLSSLSLENLQARLRAVILMAYSNEKGILALNTCNKSEDMVGYATLYGDAVGAFAPLGDLYKTEIYELANYINMRFQAELIPLNILKKPPSAELRENQQDTDTLPPYEVLDVFLQAITEYGKDPLETSRELDLSSEVERDLLRKIFSAQYKRKQSPRILMLGELAVSKRKEQWAEHQNWI